MISPVRKCTFQNIRIGARSIASSSISSLPPRSPLFNNPPLRNTFHQDEPEPLTTTKLRMIMFGKPGAGKGTLSSRLVKEFDILSLSTGDLLRQHIAERTEVGQEAEEIVAQGKLISDELALRVVTSKLDQFHNKHWILDGFPRTLGQAGLLDAHLAQQDTPLTLVISLNVPDRVILSRITDRWVHLRSGRVYNMSYNRPKVDGLDDVTGEPLIKRVDDNPEIFTRRLAEFYQSTSPLLEYYTEAAATSTPPRAPRNPNLHPHQLTFPQPHPRLRLRTLAGSTSDEIWPQLKQTVRAAVPTLRVKSEAGSVKMPHSLSDPLVVGGKPLAARIRA